MSTRYVWERWNRKESYETNKKEIVQYYINYPVDNPIFFSSEIPLINSTNGNFITSGIRFYPPRNPGEIDTDINITTYPYLTFFNTNTNKYDSCIQAIFDFEGGGPEWYLYYDSYDQILRVTDPDGNTTFYMYKVEKEYSKGTTSYGNISSSSSSTYPTNNYSGSNWYVYKGSDSIDPTVSITPNPGKGEELVTINITPSTGNVYGGTIKYKVTYSLDSGSETVLNESTSETSLQLLVPKGTESLTVYVTASDNIGFIGDKISTTISIINNSDPVITSEISNLGSIDSIFNIPYSVSDEDGDNISITEKIDKTDFRTFSTTSGNQNFTITDYQFLNITNDFHNIIIEADDGNGGTDTLNIPFTKALYTTTLALSEPMSTDALVTKCYLTLTGNIPDDSELEILVSNNPYDTSPVWEDITNYVKNNWNYQFENTSVTSNQYGFDFKLTVSRGDSNTAGNIISISGGFE